MRSGLLALIGLAGCDRVFGLELEVDDDQQPACWALEQREGDEDLDVSSTAATSARRAQIRCRKIRMAMVWATRAIRTRTFDSITVIETDE